MASPAPDLKRLRKGKEKLVPREPILSEEEISDDDDRNVRQRIQRKATRRNTARSDAGNSCCIQTPSKHQLLSYLRCAYILL